MPNSRPGVFRFNRNSPLAVLLVVIAAVVVVWALATALGYSFFSPSGQVLGVTIKDTDADGKSDKIDPDDDNDGFMDIVDPFPLNFKDLDNDGLKNSVDKDDDGDGILDINDFKKGANGKKVDLSLDQNNNGKRDEKERHDLGLKFDGDGDGRPDFDEMRQVALAQASKLGVKVSSTVKSFADIPPQVWTHMPRGWNFVANDKDNDGQPEGLDRDGFTKVADAFSAYTDKGKWADVYKEHLAKGDDKLGFAVQCLACGGSEREAGGIPTYDSPWTKGDYIKGGESREQSNKDYYQFYGTKDDAYTDRPQYNSGEYTYTPPSNSGSGSGSSGSEGGGNYSDGGNNSGGNNNGGGYSGNSGDFGGGGGGSGYSH